MLTVEIQQLLMPIINNLGYELWDCVLSRHNQYTLLRIYIDKANGISISDCEIVSKHVSAILDVENIIIDKYNLEISSVGIPRELLLKEHYIKYIGSQILIKLRQETKIALTAKIIAVNEDILILDVGDAQINVQFSQIIKATLRG